MFESIISDLIVTVLSIIVTEFFKKNLSKIRVLYYLKYFL